MTKARFSSLAAAAGLLAAATAFAPAAHATLILSSDISGSVLQCIDNQACDTNPAVGQISLAPFTLNGVQVTGNFDRSTLSSPDLLASSSTSVINNSNANRTITVAVGDTNFAGPAKSIDTSGSGTFTSNQSNGITLNWYADSANTQGATSPTSTPGTLVHTFSYTPTLQTDSFANNAPGNAFQSAGAFSMTEQFIFTLAPGGSLTSRGQTEIANVPEPASLALIGTGLVALGLVRRRKRS